MVYRDVHKKWGGLFASDYKYGYGIFAKIMNMAVVTFKLKNIYLGAKFINMGLKTVLSGL